MEQETQQAVDASQVTDSAPAQEPSTVTDDIEAKKVETVPVQRFQQIYGRMKGSEDRVRELEAQLAQAQAPAPKQAPAAPTLESFDYDETAYQSAVISQQIDQKVQAALQQQASQQQQAQLKQQQAQTAQDFNTRAAEYAAQNPDYDQLNNGVQFSESVSAAILGSQDGPALHHALLADPALAAKVNAMDATQAAMEVGRLSAQLQTTKQKPVSQAPAPIDTNTGGGAGLSSDARYNPNASPEEHHKAKMAAMRRA